MKNILVRTLSGAIYVILMIVALYIRSVFYVLFLLFMLAGLYEYSKMTSATDDKPLVVCWLVLAGIMFTALFWSFGHAIFRLCLCVTGVVVFVGLPVFELFRHGHRPIEDIANGFFALVWVMLPLLLLGFWTQVASPGMVLAFLILIWSSDTFSYLGGMLFGRHKMCQRISPNKTWEGLVIGWLMTVTLAVAFFFIPCFQKSAPQFQIRHWIIFAVLTVVFGTCGDLLESAFKRHAGLKDSGNIIPGHGGVLDRLDSILLAVYPVMLFNLLVDGFPA